MQAYARTDIGLVRQTNQDACFCSPAPIGPFPNLFIVADGMGGHNAGDFASRYTIDSFIEYIKKGEDRSLIQLVDEGIRETNRKVLEKSLSDPGLAGMGTTLVVAFIDNGQLYVANVGDSRLYLIGDEITQVTEDHSYVGAMLRAHEITEEEARCHPRKNIITRAIGVTADVDADFFEVDLKEGDRILICSDGLSNMIDDDGLFEIIKKCEIEKASEVLVEKARDMGGLDNITAIVIEPGNKEVSE